MASTQKPTGLEDVLYGFLSHNQWPASLAQAEALVKKYKTTDKLQAYLKTLHTPKAAPKGMPGWAVQALFPQVGNAVNLMRQDPGVAKIMLQAGVESWPPAKLNNMLETNHWWNNHTDQQRTWIVASDGTRNQMRQTAAQAMADRYFTLYGEMKPASAFLKDSNLDNLASGQINDTQWVGQQRQTQQYKERYPGNAARAAAGLPMLDETQYRDLEDQYKTQLGQAGYDVSKLSPQSLTNFFARDMDAQEVKSRLDAVNVLDTHGALLRQRFSQLAGLPQTATAQDMYGMLVGLRPDLHAQYNANTQTSQQLPSLQDLTNKLQKAQSMAEAEFKGGGDVAFGTPKGQEAPEAVPAAQQAAF